MIFKHTADGEERENRMKERNCSWSAHAKSLVVNLFIQASNAINYQDKMQANVADAKKNKTLPAK